MRPPWRRPDRRGRGGGRGPHGPRGPRRPGAPRFAPTVPDSFTADPAAYWRAGPGLDASPPEAPFDPVPGATLARLGALPSDDDSTVENALRRTYATATTAAASLLRR